MARNANTGGYMAESPTTHESMLGSPHSADHPRKKTDLLRRGPLRLLIVLMVSILAAETLVMLLLPRLPLPTGRWGIALDGLLLVCLAFPALYVFSFRPLAAHLAERERAERELEKSRIERLFSRKLIEVVEEERKRISRDLHDEVGQLVTSIKMESDLLTGLGNNNGTRELAMQDGIQRMLDELLDAIFRISFSLRPSMLDDLGLVPAIESLLEKFQEASGIQCEWECDLQDSNYLPEVRITVYRVLQEALTNVMRHARAPCVRVRLCEKAGKLKLAVKDSGHGFELSTVDAENCLGLAGMRERAKLAGGEFTISSSPGHGTRVELELPIQTCSEAPK